MSKAKAIFIGFLIGFILANLVHFYQDYFFAYRDQFGVIDLDLGQRITLVSLSPDDSKRVLLVERQSFRGWYRVFELYLQQQGNSDSVIIFRSPEEGRPAGSERIIWDVDSSQFALVGRHFNVIAPETAKLSDGEILYLIYDLRRQQLYCHWSDLPKFKCSPIPSNTLSEFGLENVI